jgi:hypothetical protein
MLSILKLTVLLKSALPHFLTYFPFPAFLNRLDLHSIYILSVCVKSEINLHQHKVAKPRSYLCALLHGKDFLQNLVLLHQLLFVRFCLMPKQLNHSVYACL